MSKEIWIKLTFSKKQTKNKKKFQKKDNRQKENVNYFTKKNKFLLTKSVSVFHFISFISIERQCEKFNPHNRAVQLVQGFQQTSFWLGWYFDSFFFLFISFFLLLLRWIIVSHPFPYIYPKYYPDWWYICMILIRVFRFKSFVCIVVGCKVNT